MTRLRLRPMPTADQLAAMYATPHRHAVFYDHLVRVDATIAVARWLTKSGNTIADLSCGDGAVAFQLCREFDLDRILGDYAPGYPIHGPIEQTVERLDDRGVDLFICCETIEHLDDPDVVLTRIRAKTRRLVLSTPVGNTDPGNPEHVWAWDREDVDAMLQTAGFKTIIYAALDLRPSGYPYHWGIWGCE
jgi:2-polyprenyl-3-methyl-5-hydroxy-6-metoxy-1,4-benzoquinol methylase